MWNGGTTQKNIQKLIFPAFGTILVLVAAFFLVRIQFQKYLKIDFSSFWHGLGFGGSLFLFKTYFKKVFKNWVFRLLFPWRLDRWHKHLKMWNCTLAFRKRGGTNTFLDLFVARFIWAEKRCIYIYINSSRKVFKNWFPHLLARSWFWRQLFSIQHWSKKVFKIDFSGFCSHDD